jgi:hypothetical protein
VGPAMGLGARRWVPSHVGAGLGEGILGRCASPAGTAGLTTAVPRSGSGPNSPVQRDDPYTPKAHWQALSLTIINGGGYWV